MMKSKPSSASFSQTSRLKTAHKMSDSQSARSPEARMISLGIEAGDPIEKFSIERCV